MSKFLELYSYNRDRNSYPLVSDFVVPFGSPQQNITSNQARDPILEGPIYYTFTLAPQVLPDYTGKWTNGGLDPTQTPSYSLSDNFYKGFSITDVTSGDTRLIRSSNAASGSLSFDYPFATIGADYKMFAGFPTTTTIFLPSVDNNGNVLLNYEQAYTGYYVVFETRNDFYSNADNSNIFYRRISYYDFTTQIAYFDTPLPSTFKYNEVLTPQTFTLRQTLPTSRWELETATYFSSTLAGNPAIGPLPGCYIITLPPGASDQDNFYRAKWVYYASNTPEFYSPPLPDPRQQETPIPYVFYPIYGAYYIQAYNGATRQLSVQPDRNLQGVYPSFKDTGYSSGSFIPGAGITTITQAGAEYTAEFATPPVGTPLPYSGTITLDPTLFSPGINYEITFRVKKSANINMVYFSAPGFVQYDSPCLQDTYLTFNFRVTPTESDDPYSITFVAEWNPLDLTPKTVTWDLFTMQQQDIINIVNFVRDNFYPLDYSGTMVGLNAATCWNVSLTSLSLPNLPLLTGSKIAFYPFCYVEFDNVTSPISHGTNVFYSNHPESARAMFTCAVYPVANPDQQQFMAISGGMNQSVKFKPNDSLRIRIYLPNGQLFVPILQDLLSPYPPWVRMQVQAVFSISRAAHVDK